MSTSLTTSLEAESRRYQMILKCLTCGMVRAIANLEQSLVIEEAHSRSEAHPGFVLRTGTEKATR